MASRTFPARMNTFEVALSLACGAAPVYYKADENGVEVIHPDTGEVQNMPRKAFESRYVTLYQNMPSNMRSKAASVPSYREWKIERETSKRGIFCG